MTRPSANIVPICFSYFLVIILLFQSIRPVQSIALSSLCGQFGHSCFGGKFLINIKRMFLFNFRKFNLGNWGRRELPTSSLTPDFIQSNLNINDDGTAISIEDDENLMNSLLLEQIRLVN